MISSNLNNYVKALIPNTYTIFGVKLKPFSLGHYFLMKRFECKFAEEDSNITGGFDDILLAIAICSRNYEQFLEWIDSKEEFDSWCTEWGMQMHKALKKNSINVLEHIDQFRLYMRDSIMIPKVWNNKDSEAETRSGSHWSQNIYTVLVSKLGYSQTEALNIPLSQAFYDFYKYLENEGVVTFMEEWELEEINSKE